MSEAEPSEALSERQLKIAVLVDRLTLGVPDDPSERTPEQHARWILAHCLDWHRREKKVSWWEYFRLCDLPAEDLLDERAGLGGLVFVAEVGGTAKTPVHRYRFPPQETELRGGEDVHANGGAKLGKVKDISIGDGWVDIKKRRDSADLHPEALFAYSDVNTTVLADALLRIGEYVADHGLEGEGPYQAARDLVLRHAPRVGGQPLRADGETSLGAALRLALALDGGVLPIQGPPGSGKTYRRRPHDLSDGERWSASGRDRQQPQGDPQPPGRGLSSCGRNRGRPHLHPEGDGGGRRRASAAIHDRQSDMPFSSSWRLPGRRWDGLALGSSRRPSMRSTCSSSTRRPKCPLRTCWPCPRRRRPSSSLATLNNSINRRKAAIQRASTRPRSTISWRATKLSPRTAGFSWKRPGVSIQRSALSHRNCFTKVGSIPVLGWNCRKSDQPVCSTARACVICRSRTRAIRAHHRRRRRSFAAWSATSWPRTRLGSIERDAKLPLILADILIIAPYNAQVFELQSRLPSARIGTVDKFQGQEAPVVIYSMTTSSHADAPRGMEFLYSLNRLNVATSRAKCICVLVASPMVFEADCRTPDQMRLANAYCRYLELAQPI